MIELRLIAVIFILLFISIIFIGIWREIANLIGEEIRKFFINLWKFIKGVKIIKLNKHRYAFIEVLILFIKAIRIRALKIFSF